jgi:predicted dithiol-disulfide oxidoreductase (DUF899 family)
MTSGTRAQCLPRAERCSSTRRSSHPDARRARHCPGAGCHASASTTVETDDETKPLAQLCDGRSQPLVYRSMHGLTARTAARAARMPPQ